MNHTQDSPRPWTETEWSGCYRDGWKGILTDESFAHPAKFSRGLIRRIYRHMMECGWISVGDTVVDPFGGVACGARDALELGIDHEDVLFMRRSEAP